MTSVKDLKRYSIHCRDGMLVTDEHGKGVTEFYATEKYPRTFCTQNGKLAFFDERGKLYLTLWTSATHAILENAGYERKGFEIPFSDGKIPFDEEVLERYVALFK